MAARDPANAPHVVDLFFVTEDSALIVEQRAGENLRLDELDGLFVALDMDFDCYSHLFVGPFHHSSHDFTLLLTEEMTLFQQLTRQTNLKSLDLATSLIHLLSTAGSDYQLLFRTLYQDWFQESDLYPFDRVAVEKSRKCQFYSQVTLHASQYTTL